MAGDLRSSILLDTGAALAILNERDPWHDLCLETFRQLPLPLLTSEAVLTELFHLVGRFRSDAESAWALIRSGALALATIAESELSPLHELMTRYSDHPMDFADATLVYLAKRESISTIFTVDHADFSTYRIEGKRRFRILPVDAPRR